MNSFPYICIFLNEKVRLKKFQCSVLKKGHYALIEQYGKLLLFMSKFKLQKRDIINFYKSIILHSVHISL